MLCALGNMLSLFGLIQAGVLEPVIESFSTRSLVEVAIDWARQASDYFQKEEGGPLAEFRELLFVFESSTVFFEIDRFPGT